MFSRELTLPETLHEVNIPIAAGDTGNWDVGVETYGGPGPECAKSDMPERATSQGLWETEKPACGSTLAAFHSKSERRVRVIRLRCGRLDCPVCGPYWRKRLTDRLNEFIIGHGQLFLTSASKTDWKALSRGLQRKLKDAHPDAGRVEGWAAWTVDNEVFVISTVAHQLRAGQCTITPIDRKQAQEIVRSLVRGLTDKKSFSSSFSWGQRKQRAAYQLLGYAEGSLEVAREATRRFGLHPERVVIAGQEGFQADVEEELVQAWWKAVKDALRETGPRAG